MKISKHENFKEEYCATVVRIGEIEPIEGRDRIVKTLVNGMSIVIGKDDFKEGDIAIYCANETKVDAEFLHLNNMFEDKEMNANNTKRGYVNKHGRIRVVKLGGVPSYGMLIPPKALAAYTGESVKTIAEYLESHVGEDFDEINGNRFCQVYVPPSAERKPRVQGQKKNKADRFDMIIDGSFRFHYDTKQLAKEFYKFSPDDVVTISVKLHGTSAIFANIETYVPTNWFKRMWRKYVSHKPQYDKAYNLVYSSRTVIKNRYINPHQTSGYYSDDVWGHWAKKIKKIDGPFGKGAFNKNWAIYCEIVGYTPNGSPIQKGYDYGCKVGESKLMVYRATYYDLEAMAPDVADIAKELVKQGLDANEIIPLPILYHGPLKDLYPDIAVDEHWHRNVLERLKKDERFGMEKNEPMCNNKVPREGIVLRLHKDPTPEAFKLKTDAYRMREAKEVDAGNVDIEMEQGYTE